MAPALLPIPDTVPTAVSISPTLDFSPPSPQTLKTLLAGHHAWFAPRFYGLENLQGSKPALFVGNHTVMGVLDSPLLVLGIYEHTGIYLRSLGDRAHFSVPGWRSLLRRFGAVEGSRDNCRALMAAGANILVFPGGGREVFKNRGESYRLIWKKRTGFAALAMEFGYDIIPFAAVGAEEAYRIRYDANDFRASRLGQLMARRGLLDKYLRGGDFFAPLVTGLPGTAIPRPEKFYFQFGARIPTVNWQHLHEDSQAQWYLRMRVEKQVYAQIEKLFHIREADADWPWWRRRLTGRD